MTDEQPPITLTEMKTRECTLPELQTKLIQLIELYNKSIQVIDEQINRKQDKEWKELK